MILAGDQLAVDLQQNQPSYGGFTLAFTDQTGSGDMTDIATGTPFYFDGVSGPQWQHLLGDLSPYAGKTVSEPFVGIHENMPAGTFDMYFANARIVHADGTTVPLLWGQNVTALNFTGSSCAGSGFTSDSNPAPVTDAAEGTTYYLDDKLGTTQVELSNGGVPLWQGQFTPFGAELPDGPTAMHYKFTGKERDTESGLDLMGARYYASAMGRFMTPDPSGVAYARQSNPQSFNLYSYALNNPLRFVDPTGLTICDWGPSDQGGEDYDNDDDCAKDGGTVVNVQQQVDVNGNTNGDYLATLQSANFSTFVQVIPGSNCSSALKTAGANSQAMGRYYQNYQSTITNAANANGIPPDFLAAVGIRESGLQNIAQTGGGLGRGVFQIDLGANPGVTPAQAFNVNYSANFAAQTLSSNEATIASAHPNLDPANLMQATAASYNFGTGNISGNPNTIDVGTTGGNYGSNVMAISGSCFIGQ